MIYALIGVAAFFLLVYVVLDRLTALERKVAQLSGELDALRRDQDAC